MAKKDKENEEEITREKIKEVLEEVRPKIVLEEKKEDFFVDEVFYTEEYYRFLKDIKKYPETLYEKLCWKAKEIIKIKPDPKTRDKLKVEIETAYMNVTPEGVLSLSVLIFIAGIVLTVFGLLLTQDILFSLFLLLLFSGFSWYAFSYPSMKSKEIQVRMASDLVIAILYMVVYMRNSPNLEGALKFAAENLTGPLSWDMKKLIWGIEVGKYPSLEIALQAYMAKWEDKNEEFVEALQLLRASTQELVERRLMLLDEAVNVILDGTRDKMRAYARELRLPVTLVYAMGIMLPTIGLVMFPIFALFLSDLVKPIFLFLGYDVILPVFLYWYMSNVLKTKPVTFSQPEVSHAKGVPPLGKFRLFRKDIYVLPVSVLISIPFILYSIYGIANVSLQTMEDIQKQTFYSVMLIVGIALGIASYAFLDSFQKMRLRKKIERIEEEFGEALFQFGNQIASGRPLEHAIFYAIHNMRNLKIADLFREAGENMKKLGLTLDQALFDPRVGVLNKYPSRLIKSVFKVAIESAKKSVKLSALTMLTLSRYMKGVKSVKEDIKSMLSETLTSMRFLAMFLAPLISGIIVTMGIVIMQLLFVLSGKMQELMANVPAGVPSALLWLWSGGGKGPPITPWGFQLIVGLYTIETAVLLAIFLNKLEYGEDAIGLRDNIAKIVFFALCVYLFSWWLSFVIFGPVIEKIITPLEGF